MMEGHFGLTNSGADPLGAQLYLTDDVLVVFCIVS